MTDQSDRMHSLILVFAWAALVIFLVSIYVFKLDFDRFFPWFFVASAAIEAYGAYFLREGHRWAFSAAMFLVGAGLVAKDLWGFKTGTIFEVCVALGFVVALVFQVRYWQAKLQPGKDKP